MTLLELAKQYESDVGTRLDILIEKLHKCTYLDNKDFFDDCKTQIAHWQATLKTIRETIKENI